jgi:hypothetical protein
MTHSLSLNSSLVILSITPLLAVHNLTLFLYLRCELSSNARRCSDLGEDSFLKLYSLVVLLDPNRIRATTPAYHLGLGADPATRGPTTFTFLHICDFLNLKLDDM